MTIKLGIMTVPHPITLVIYQDTKSIHPHQVIFVMTASIIGTISGLIVMTDLVSIPGTGPRLNGRLRVMNITNIRTG